MDGTCSSHREIRNATSVLGGKPEGKRPLVKPRYRWEHNIKIYVKEIGCEDANWTHLVQDRIRTSSSLIDGEYL
jgi:hypothetical protein